MASNDGCFFDVVVHYALYWFCGGSSVLILRRCLHRQVVNSREQAKHATMNARALAVQDLWPADSHDTCVCYHCLRFSTRPC